MKPHKGYYGLYNQYVLSSILQGTPLPVAADDQKALRELEEDVNAKLDTRDMLAFRFRQLASIYHQLADVGKEFDAIVTRIRDDEVLFEVPGFSKWGQLRSGDGGMQGSLSAALIEGHDVLTEGSSVVRVRLMGFDPEKMRFVFAPVTVH